MVVVEQRALYLVVSLNYSASKMSILKVIEILASSDTSWEEAAQNAVNEASKTVRNIRSCNIQNMSSVVEDGKIKEFRVNCKVAFEVG